MQRLALEKLIQWKEDIDRKPLIINGARQVGKTWILKEFGMDESKSHIINGHIPVKEKDGESPIKANGKLLVIDRWICKEL